MNENTDHPLNNPHFDELIAMAKEFVAALKNGHYVESVKHFDETMTKLAPPEKMKEVWEAVIKQVGHVDKAVIDDIAQAPLFSINPSFSFTTRCARSEILGL